MVKRILFFSTYVIFCLACFLAIFEVIFRYQLVDFYRPELRAFNRAADLGNSPRKTLMGMGDSLTAGWYTWLAYLRRQLPAYRVINGAISATGIFEPLYTAPRRFREFHPQVFIYQVFVGNDLQDIRRPLNWRTMTLPRYVYCFMCSYLRLHSLSFANYRLGQLLHNPGSGTTQITDPPFSSATYPKSVRIYTQAEPYNLEDTVLASGERAPDVVTLIAGIKKLCSYAGPDCRKYVVVIPDSAQVNDLYLDHLKQLGAQVRDPQALHQADYPLVIRLRKELAVAGIKVLNPLPLFQGLEQLGQRLYYQNDPHLKPVGQTVLGQFVLQELKADGLTS